MSLIKWEPFGDLDRFFGDDVGGFPSARSLGWDLSTNVFEKDGMVIMEMNVPGIDPEKLDISIEDGYVRVSGSREEKDEKKEKQYYSKEIRYGSFEKVVRLPEGSDSEKANAEYESGVLRITLPKLVEKPKGKLSVKVKK